MQRRLHMIRHHMEANEVDAFVFTSYHNVHYFSDFLYCYFGRPYAFIVTANRAMSVSAGKDASIFLRYDHKIILLKQIPYKQEHMYVQNYTN